MKHRIRAAAIIIDEEKILLIKHVHPVTQFTWWVPPGGGVELEDASIIDCVKREVFEETGLQVDVESDLRFIREFFDKTYDTLNIEIFFDARVVGGNLSMEHIAGNGVDEDFIKDVKWCTIADLQNVIVYPEILKDNFGRNAKNIYLGRQRG
ncbi:MAG: NUDIX hydrolase [Parcubacteria group bacterium]|jgi:8-oxo-dGTP pyrophosphatase MutT (NUDIX family)